MTDEKYVAWKELRDAAADAMRLADRKREDGDFAEWDIFVKRAIALQELATNVA